MKNIDDKYQAPALEKGLEIMEYLSLKAASLSQAEIASGIIKKPNEIYRMLVCLEKKGYVMRDEVSGKYKLTLKLFHLSHRHSPVDDIRRAAQHPMDELALDINQSCHLGILYSEKLMVIAQSRSPGPVSLSIEEGSLFPLLQTTSGRVLLAFMAQDQQNYILQSNQTYINQSAKDKKLTLAMLQQIRETGYLVKDSDSTRSVTDVCVPLLTSQGDLLATLTVAALTARDEPSANFENVVAKTQLASRKILSRLGVC
ncbi:MAG TPA: IclR family transcriptional regulator [Dyadobacter sp.]|jgi:DNA-binding IclR family transcriptional regulator|nr:IclR family transcriptional regulator [Dyadobacter sp.]